jgi:hypothetical protein
MEVRVEFKKLRGASSADILACGSTGHSCPVSGRCSRADELATGKSPEPADTNVRVTTSAALRRILRFFRHFDHVAIAQPEIRGFVSAAIQNPLARFAGGIAARDFNAGEIG